MDIINEWHRIQRVDEPLYPGGRVYRSPIDAIVCADGFRISVQASEHSYCSPRVTEDTEYREFECGFPSGPVPTLQQWKEGDGDDTRSVYGYVPVQVIVDLVNSHGGISQ